MSTLTVTRDVEGHSGALPIPIDAINYFEYEQTNNRIIVHTLDDTYYTMGTLKYWMNAIEGAGYDYVVGDRNTAINISNIVQIDTVLRVAYFEDSSVQAAKQCLLSVKGMVRVLEKTRCLRINNSHLRATFG